MHGRSELVEGIVSPEEVRRIAALIQLEVGDEEAEELGRHFQKVMGYFARLREMDLEGVEPFTPGEPRITLREDVETPWEERGEVLDRAPFREGDFFRVPRMERGEEPRREGEGRGGSGEGGHLPPGSRSA